MTRILGYLFICTIVFSCAKDDVEPTPSIEDFFEETEVEDFSHMMSDFEVETLALINAFRAEGNNCGEQYMEPAEPLMWHPNLDNAAEAHANDMFQNDVLTHEGSDGSNLDTRLQRANYPASHWGENVAKGPITPAQCVQAFKDSPGHCKVMSSPNFRQVGIAKIGEYWVFDFGTLR
jgi:uncharacterized protein YkwD